MSDYYMDPCRFCGKFCNGPEDCEKRKENYMSVTLIDKLEALSQLYPGETAFDVGYTMGAKRSLEVVRAHTAEMGGAVANALYFADNGEEYGLVPEEQNIVPYKKMAKAAIAAMNMEGTVGSGDSLCERGVGSSPSPSVTVSEISYNEMQDSFESARKALYEALKAYSLLVERNFYKLSPPEPVTVSLEECAEELSRFWSPEASARECSKNVINSVKLQLKNQGIEVSYD